MKIGCQIEKRQFDDAEDLLKCPAFGAIAAWRVFDLHRMAKYEPDRPTDEMMVIPGVIVPCAVAITA
ncbi:MAG: hypothetical protein OXI60_02535 [Acidiferrobacterales bacterium]|nr:hypothetical protein [Acidiferrobacterales bacterium]